MRRTGWASYRGSSCHGRRDGERHAIDRRSDPSESPYDSFLDTADVHAELRSRSVRSGFAQLGAQPIKIALLAAAGMALARLLTPRDFGVYAMAASWIAFVNSTQGFGFHVAVVQRDVVAERQLNALFWLNLKLSLLAVGATLAVAPLLARFYGEPAVTGVTMAMAVGLLGMSLGWQHRSLLMRRLEFGTAAAIDLGALTASVFAAVGAALVGAGYWALVVQFVVVAVTSTALLWTRVGWRPDRGVRPGSRIAIGPLVRYGWQYTGARVLAHVGHNLDRVLVAFFAGSRATGLYDNAFRWAHYPVHQVFGPVGHVAIAGLSRAREGERDYVAAIRDALLPLLSISLPALAFMALESGVVILVLLGDQWLDAVPLFRWLCVAAFARSLISVTHWVYASEGRTDRELRWMAIEATFLIAAVAVGVTWGAYGVAVAFTAGLCLLAGPALAYCLRGSPLTPRGYLAIAWRPVAATLAGSAALRALEGAIPPTGGQLSDLVLRLGLFGIVYAVVWVGAPGGRRAFGRLSRLPAELRRGGPGPPGGGGGPPANRPA